MTAKEEGKNTFLINSEQQSYISGSTMMSTDAMDTQLYFDFCTIFYSPKTMTTTKNISSDDDMITRNNV